MRLHHRFNEGEFLDVRLGEAMCAYPAGTIEIDAQDLLEMCTALLSESEELQASMAMWIGQDLINRLPPQQMEEYRERQPEIFTGVH